MRDALSLAALATLSPAQAVTYTLLDRGQAFGQATAARAINSLGQVVGTRFPRVGLNQAYLYDASGQLAELGTLGGTYSSGYAVNDRGQAVGGLGTAASSYHAFLWTPGVDMQDGHLLVADGARIAR